MKRRIAIGLTLIHLALTGNAHGHQEKLALAKLNNRLISKFHHKGTLPATGYPRLRETQDADLQSALWRSLKELKLEQAADQQALSLALVDVTDPAHPRMAQVNGDKMFYAASLPKIAILLGAFQRIAEGEMELDAETREALTLMIRNSSNRAATAMLNRVGKAYLADLLQSPPYKFYDQDQGGGLWVGKEYAKKGAWKRDPLHNISHGATALQVARFYYYLDTGRLVSRDYSEAMKAILADSAINHKFVRGLGAGHPEAKLYRKSGSWGNAHADSALIEHGGKRYIAVGLANNPQGGQWLSRLIVKMDEVIATSAHPAEKERRVSAVSTDRSPPIS